MLPGNFGQLAQGFQLAKLCFIIGIGNTAWPKPIAKRKSHIIGLHDFADLFKMRIQEIFFVMCQAPFGHDRAPARYNSGYPFGR
ncbi:hypothetical protein D3C86_1946230 [compost metagenome]